MPTVYLHVGMPKTGTSAFQRFLLEQEQWLSERSYHVPVTGRDRHGAHHFLIRAIAGLPGPSDSPDLPAELAEEISKAGTPDLIISSELMGTVMRAPELLDRYIQYFQSNGYSIAVILYVREKLDSFNSGYSQLIKSLRYAESFEAFVTTRVRSMQLPLFWQLLKSSPDVRLIARPYNADVRSRGIVRAIVEELGLDWQGASPPRVNSSPGPMAIHLSRWLRQHIDASQQRPNIRHLNHAKTAVNKLVGRESVVYSGLTNELVARIEGKVSEANARMTQDLWGKPWAECFPAETEQNYIANDFDIVPPDSATLDSFQTKKAALAEEWDSIWNDESHKRAEDWPRAVPDAMHAAGIDIERLGLSLKNI